ITTDVKTRVKEINLEKFKPENIKLKIEDTNLTRGVGKFMIFSTKALSTTRYKLSKITTDVKSKVKEINMERFKPENIKLKIGQTNLKRSLAGFMILCIIALSVTGYKINKI